MDTELLDAEEVLSSRNLAGDSRGVRGCDSVNKPLSQYWSAQLTTHIPRSLATGECGANLLDLEPVGRSICSGCRVDLGHVKRDRSLVVDGLVCGERDGGAGSYRDGCSPAARVSSCITA